MIYRHFSPVPKVFWSLETGMPFSRCSMCACDLMEEGVNYLVEKAYQKKEALFEYAMCYECYLGVQESLSEQSKKLIANYFEEHVDFDSRMYRMLEKNGKRTRSWLANAWSRERPVGNARSTRSMAGSSTRILSLMACLTCVPER